MLKKFFSPAFGVGVLILLGLSLPFAFSNLDITLSALAYDHGWRYGEYPLWTALYRFGTLPGLLLGAWSLAAFLGSWVKPSWQRWRRPAAVILVTLLLGPGLLVNVLGKGYWGRPRPRDVSALGGTERFQRFCEPGVPGRGKSFPSGHPSVGYLFCALFFLDPQTRRRWVWLASGLAYGTLMGAGRVIQGAHFASDVLWSGGFTFLSAAWAARVLPAFPVVPRVQSWFARHSRGAKFFLIALGAVLLAGLSFFFLLATPFFKTWDDRMSGPKPERISLDLPAGLSTVRIARQDQSFPLKTRAEYQGFGFPKLSLTGAWQTRWEGTTLHAHLDLNLSGWVTEKRGTLFLVVPEGVQILWEKPGGPGPGVVVFNDLGTVPVQ